jgi:hypothetical protein
VQWKLKMPEHFSGSVDWLDKAGQIMLRLTAKPSENGFFMNAQIGGAWGADEKIEYEGDVFAFIQDLVVVSNAERGFTLFADGMELHEFRHRVPFDAFAQCKPTDADLGWRVTQVGAPLLADEQDKAAIAIGAAAAGAYVALCIVNPAVDAAAAGKVSLKAKFVKALRALGALRADESSMTCSYALVVKKGSQV